MFLKNIWTQKPRGPYQETLRKLGYLQLLQGEPGYVGRYTNFKFVNHLVFDCIVIILKTVKNKYFFFSIYRPQKVI